MDNAIDITDLSDNVLDAVLALEMAKRGGPKVALRHLTDDELSEYHKAINFQRAALCRMVRFN